LNGYSQGTDGTITVSYTYTLTTAPEVTGTDTMDAFTIDAQDRDGDSDTKTLNIKIVDDAPAAQPDTNTIDRGVAHPGGYTNEARGDIHANDIDGADGAAVGGPVTGVALHDPADPLVDVAGGVGPVGIAGQYGQLFLQADGSYRYVLDTSNPQVAALLGNETLVETFAYTITDADGDTSTSTLAITIRGNTPPVARDDTRTTPEDTPVSGNVITSNVDGDQPDGDQDDIDTLVLTTIEVDTDGDGTTETYTVPADPSTPLVVEIIGKGSLTIGSDGAYTFVPVSDWNGQVPDIRYTTFDGVDRDDSAVLRITVTPVVDVTPDRTKTESSTPVTINPLDNDSFSNPDARITEVTQGGFGTVVITPDGRITYTPKPGMSGTDTFTYTVTSGGITETTTVTVEVMPENPVAVTPSYPSYPGGWVLPRETRSPINNSVVGEPSVFFYGDVFDKLPRMDVPFHPIVYVNREVQVAQKMREWSDLRTGGGNTDYVELALMESRLVSQRIRMAHVLYVHDEVSEARRQGWLWSAKVESDYTTTELAGDGRLPTPGLYSPELPSLLAPKQGDSAPRAQDTPDASAPADAAAQDAGGDQALRMPSDGPLQAAETFAGTAAWQSDFALHDGDEPIAAPSFSAQLRGGQAQLPGAMWASQGVDAVEIQQS
ncbi:MAG: Ig-like domain-containing protein, partial [Burkholderiaceae bacterium]